MHFKIYKNAFLKILVCIIAAILLFENAALTIFAQQLQINAEPDADDGWENDWESEWYDEDNENDDFNDTQSFAENTPSSEGTFDEEQGAFSEDPFESDFYDNLPDSTSYSESAEMPDDTSGDDGTEGNENDGETEPLVDSAASFAEEPVLLSSESLVYNLNTLPQFSGRTQSEVTAKYAEAVNAGASYINNDETSYYSEAASVNAPMKQGTLTEDTLKVMQGMTDFYRWLSGVQPLTSDSKQTAGLQMAALVRNFYYSKTVSGTKPEGMNNTIWQKGSSVTVDLLTRNQSPQDAVTNMMNCGCVYESTTFYGMSNRALLTDPSLSSLRFGYSGNIAVGKAQAYDNSGAADFIAYPAPGYDPADLIDGSHCAWNLKINTDEVVISDENRLKVVVDNLTTGNSYTCTLANGRIELDDSAGIIFRQPPYSAGYAGRTYRVTVSGLTNADGTQPVEITYTVSLFNVRDQVDSYAATYSFDYTELVINKSMNSTAKLKKIEALLPQKVTVKDGSGNSYQISVSENWKLDQKNSCYVTSAAAGELPDRVKDRFGILKKITMPYVISDSMDSALTGVSASKNPVAVSSSLTVTITRLDYLNLNKTELYRVKANGDGTYSGEKKLESEVSASFVKSSRTSTNHRYKIQNVKASDAGEYIAIARSTYFHMAAYVSAQFLELELQTPKITYSTSSGSSWKSASDGAASGTAGSGRKTEALKVSLSGYGNSSVSYKAYVQGKGWESKWSSGGAVSGKARSGRRVEAIRIKLSGDIAENYDLYYCVYVRSYGWLAWTKNGGTAGTTGKNLPIESVRIRLVKKGSSAPKKLSFRKFAYYYGCLG